MPISHCLRIYLFPQWPRVTTSSQLSPMCTVLTPEPWHDKGETTAWPLVHFQTLSYFIVYLTILLSQPNARLKQGEGEIVERFHWLGCECCILWDQLLDVSLTLGYSLELQWLGLHVFSSVGTDSIPGRRTRIPQALWHVPTHTTILLHSMLAWPLSSQ